MSLFIPKSLSLKWKILIGCVGLSLMILAAGAVFTSCAVMETAHRGGEMQSVFRRYVAYQKGLSRGYAAAAEVWTNVSRVRELFAAGDDDAARPLVNEALQRLGATLHPDFILFVDKHGDLSATPGAPIDAGDVKSMRVFADLKLGMTITDQVIEHRGRAWLVEGSPIMQGTQNVGALVMGQHLERVFAEFKAASDDDPKKQVELALVHNQVTTASTAATDLWDDIARATPAEKRVADGDGSSVIMLEDGKHEFFSGQINGYDGASTGLVGSLFVLRSRAERDARMRGILRYNLFLFGAALLFAVVVSFVMAHLITRPILQFIRATRDLAHGEGDLTQRLMIDSNATEMLELADNLNAVFANLHKLASEVQVASLQVGASSAEISAASKQMLGGASDQAGKIESSTAAVTELSSSIQQVAENAVQATKVAQDSGDQLQIGIRRLGETAALIDDTAVKIQALGQSGKRIGNIVEVIRQISEQTSLLALNASIEAAHAGEQGRGFAVVAEEVSSLARRVGQSAKDIEGLIASITEQTAEAVSSMQNATRSFSEHTAGTAMMQSSLRRIVEVVQDTARSVQEQAIVSDEIARNMDAVQKITHEVLGSSEEAVVQGESLHQLALRLEQLVRGFRIETAENGAGPSRSEPAALPEKSSERRRVARS